MSTTYQEMLTYIHALPISDVHEHILADVYRLDRYDDYIALVVANYVRSVAVSGGILQSEIDFMQAHNPLEEKYAIFSRLLPLVKYSYSFRCLEIAFQEIYGVSLLDADYHHTNEVYCARNQLGVTAEIAQQFHIEFGINDAFFPTIQGTDYNMGGAWLRNSARCDRYVMVQDHLREVEEEWQTTLPTLDALIAQWDVYLKMQVEEYGAIAIKLGVAYDRDIKFYPIDYDRANAVYQQMLAALAKGETLPRAVIRDLEDYMVHEVAKSAQAYQLPIQIHTGMHEGNLSFLEESHPLLLNNFIAAHPDVKFDIFHIGFPYARETGTLVRTYPNAYTNFSFAYVGAPVFATEILEEYIGFLPINKFSIFGGDFMHIEGSIGQLRLAQEHSAKMFAKLVDSQRLTLADAKEIAYRIFYANGKELYRL